MSAALRVTGLWRYPVKSMAGEPLSTVSVGPAGVLGDRVLALALADTGRILTARQEPALLWAGARWLGEEVEITLPTGRAVRSTDPGADGVLSAWLGRAVRLEGPGDRPRTVPPSLDDPGSTEWQLAPGALADEAPLHLLDQRSLEKARRWHPAGDWDVRRFRPNVLLAGPLGAPPVGRRLALGGALVAVTGPCRRCVMVTRPQPGLPADRDVLRAVVRQAGTELGTYAAPVQPGEVRLGDRVDTLPDLAAEGVGSR